MPLLRRHLEVLYAFAAFVAIIGLVVVPSVAVAALSAFGLWTLTRQLPSSAALVGKRALLSRMVVGASLGPWLLMLAPSVSRGDALQAAAIGALFGLFSVEMGRALGDARRDGLLRAFGLRASEVSSRGS
jgi:hypothetical protein